MTKLLSFIEEKFVAIEFTDVFPVPPGNENELAEIGSGGTVVTPPDKRS